MGSEVYQLLKNDYDIICYDKGANLGKISVDLVVDFASAKSSVKMAEYCFETKTALIVGSTGQTEEEFKTIKKVSTVAPLMVCQNFSIGIVIVRNLIKEILNQDIDDICIYEKHHKHKKDSPSGTAKTLLFDIQSYGKTATVLSERGGEEIGKHKVDFYFGSELISVEHTAFSRKAFARGAVLAIEFMLNQTNNQEYDFQQICQNFKFQNKKFDLKQQKMW